MGATCAKSPLCMFGDGYEAPSSTRDPLTSESLMGVGMHSAGEVLQPFPSSLFPPLLGCAPTPSKGHRATCMEAPGLSRVIPHHSTMPAHGNYPKTAQTMGAMSNTLPPTKPLSRLTSQIIPGTGRQLQKLAQRSPCGSIHQS
mmetsp:Transcript_124700/g.216096  ORF Transcript_124700/g.216096 Transcript_124700/m.216096 type:complete len:143 (+) Transcript_124700:91-519(+)